MGTLGVILPDNQAAYYNPALLAFLDGDHALLSFYPQRTVLSGSGSGCKDTYEATVLTAKVRDGIALSSLPVGIGFAYQRVRRTVGPMVERTYEQGTIEGTGNTFSWEERADCFSVGLGYSGPVDIGVGLMYVDLAQECRDLKGSGRAFGCGLLLRLPLNGLRSTSREVGGARLNATFCGGMSFSNYGSAIWFAGEEYTLPKTGRFGIGIDVTYDSERIRWLSVFPAFELEILFPGEDQSAMKFGMEVGLADALFLRVGTVNAPEEGIDLNTYGLGLSSRGIKQMLWRDKLDVSGDGSNLGRFLLARLNVEFSYARVDREGHLFVDDIGYYGINIIL